MMENAKLGGGGTDCWGPPWTEVTGQVRPEPETHPGMGNEGVRMGHCPCEGLQWRTSTWHQEEEHPPGCQAAGDTGMGLG